MFKKAERKQCAKLNDYSIPLYWTYFPALERQLVWSSMAKTSVLDPYGSLIRELVERDNFTLREVGKYLTDNVGIEQGCSERNLQDFCCARNIHHFGRGRMSQLEIDNTVRELVHEVSSCNFSTLTAYCSFSLFEALILEHKLKHSSNKMFIWICNALT